MCSPKWSNRDLFTFVTDCHIYLPIHQFILSLLIILSAIILGYGLIELINRKRKDIPFAATWVGFFYFLPNLIMATSGMTYADRYVGLNILHAFGRSGLWVIMGLLSLRHLEVISAVDEKTKAKSIHLYQFLKKVNYFMFIFNSIIEISGMLIPTVNSQYRIIDWLAGTTILLIALNGVPRVAYAYKVRAIILSLKTHSQDSTYVTVIKQLTKLIVGLPISVFMGSVVLLSMVFIPIFNANLYIPYNLQQLFLLPIGLFILVITKGTKDQGSKQNSSGRNQPQPVSEHSSHGHSKSSAHDSNPNSIILTITPPVTVSTLSRAGTRTPGLSTSQSQEDFAPLVHRDNKLDQSSSQPIFNDENEPKILWNPHALTPSLGPASTPSLIPSLAPGDVDGGTPL